MTPSGSLCCRGRTRAWPFSLPAAFSTLACSSTAPPSLEREGSVLPLGERLAEEAARIPSLLGLDELLLLFVYGVVALLAAEGVGAFVHGMWRLGFDVERKLGRWLVFIKLLLALVLLYVVLRRFVTVAPVLSGAAMVVFAAVALATLRGSLESLAVGVGLAFRGRFKPGDRIVVAEYTGTVREIGLTGVHLRSPEGTTVFLPNRLLHDHAVLVTRAENTASVIVSLRPQHEPTPEDLDRVRRGLLLSPYRSIGTPVRAVLRHDGSLEVEIQAQSSLLVADAERQLETSLRAVLTAAP